MNIFYLDGDPLLAAQYHNDRHCVKSILEYAQILSTAHYLAGGQNHPLLCKATHIHHPCTKWAAASIQNYRWLADLGLSLCLQYLVRYHRVHAWQKKMEWLFKNEPPLPDSSFTSPPQCVTEECKNHSCITAYRQYYIKVKSQKMKMTWKNGIPQWYAESMKDE